MVDLTTAKIAEDDGGASGMCAWANAVQWQAEANGRRRPIILRLTDEQKRLVKALIEEYEPKLAQFQTEVLDSLTKEQRQARAESFRRSREAPASGKAIRETSISDLKLSEEEQQRLEETRAQKSRMKQEALQKFHALLTEEQRQIIENLQGTRKNRPDARTLLKNHSETPENAEQTAEGSGDQCNRCLETLHFAVTHRRTNRLTRALAGRRGNRRVTGGARAAEPAAGRSVLESKRPGGVIRHR